MFSQYSTVLTTHLEGECTNSYVKSFSQIPILLVKYSSKPPSSFLIVLLTTSPPLPLMKSFSQLPIPLGKSFSLIIYLYSIIAYPLNTEKWYKIIQNHIIFFRNWGLLSHLFRCTSFSKCWLPNIEQANLENARKKHKKKRQWKPACGSCYVYITQGKLIGSHSGLLCKDCIIQPANNIPLLI